MTNENTAEYFVRVAAEKAAAEKAAADFDAEVAAEFAKSTPADGTVAQRKRAAFDTVMMRRAEA